MKIIGIYKIENKITNKIYIGSSQDIKSRWVDHKFLLNKNQHHSSHLQHAWNKYGKDSFEFSILEECNKEELLKREQFYLDSLLYANLYIKEGNNYFLINGYNIKPFAESNLGFKHSEKTKEKIRSKSLKVYGINVDGEILGTFNSTTDAALYFNIQVNRVQLSTKNKKCIKNSEIGFIYIKDWYEGYKPKIVEGWMKGKKGVLKNSRKNEVYVYDIKGNFIEKMNSQLECCNKYNINPCNLVRSLNEKIRIERLFNRKRAFFFRRTLDDESIKILQQQIN